MPPPPDILARIVELSGGDENTVVGADKARRAEEAALAAYRQDYNIRTAGGRVIDTRSNGEHAAYLGFLNNARRARGLEEINIKQNILTRNLQKEFQPDGPAATVGGAIKGNAQAGLLSLTGLTAMALAPLSPITMDDAGAAFEAADLAGQTEDDFLLKTIGGLTRAGVELAPTIMSGGLAGHFGKKLATNLAGSGTRTVAAEQFINKVAQRSALAGVSTTAGVQNASPEYFRLRREGVEPLEAFTIAASKGVVTAGVTSLFGLTGAEALANPITRAGAKISFKEIAKQSGLEIAEEEIDLILNNFVDVAAGRPSLTFADFLDQSGQTAIIAGILGGGVTTAQQGRQVINHKAQERQRQTQEKIQQAEQDALAEQQALQAQAEQQALDQAGNAPLTGQDFDPTVTALTGENVELPELPAQVNETLQQQGISTLQPPAVDAPQSALPASQDGALPFLAPLPGETLAPPQVGPAVAEAPVKTPKARLPKVPAETPLEPPAVGGRVRNLARPDTPAEAVTPVGEVALQPPIEPLAPPDVKAAKSEDPQLLSEEDRRDLPAPPDTRHVDLPILPGFESKAVDPAESPTPDVVTGLPAVESPADRQADTPELFSVTRPFISSTELKARKQSPRAAAVADAVIKARIAKDPAAEGRAVASMRALPEAEQNLAGMIVEEQQRALDQDPSGATAEELRNSAVAVGALASTGTVLSSEPEAATRVATAVAENGTDAHTAADAAQHIDAAADATSSFETLSESAEFIGDSPLLLMAAATGLMMTNKPGRKLVKSFGKALTWMPSLFLRAVHRRIGVQGGAVGKQLENRIKHVADIYKKKKGQLFKLQNTYELAAGGHSQAKNILKRIGENIVTATTFGKTAAALRQLAHIEYARFEGKSEVLVGVGRSIFVDAVENRMPDKLVPQQQSVINGYRALAEKSGMMAEDSGLMIRVSVKDSETGKITQEMIPFIHTENGEVFVRRFHPDAMARLQNGDAVFIRAFAEATVAVNPELSGLAGDIEAELVLISKHNVNQLSAMETMRKVKILPAGIQIRGPDGDIVEAPILNTDPMSAGKALVESTANRLAYSEEFGQDAQSEDINSFKWAQEYIKAVERTGGNPDRAREDVIIAARLMHGMPAYDADTKYIFNPTNKGWFAARRYAASVPNVMGALTLSAAVIPNLSEPIGSSVVTGSREYAAAMRDLAMGSFTDETGLLTGTPGTKISGVSAITELLAEQGAISVEVLDLAAASVRNKLESNVGKVVQVIGDITLVRTINEILERGSALAAVHLVANMKMGRGNRALQAVRMLAMGYNQDTALRMATGKGTDAEYQSVIRRMPSFLQNANAAPVERSKVENSRWANQLIRFWAFANAKNRQVAAHMGMWSEAMKMAKSTSDPKFARALRLQANRQVLQFFAQNVVAGGVARTLQGIARSGTAQAALHAYWVQNMFDDGEDGEEARKELAKFTFDSTQYALFGGYRDATIGAMINEHNEVGFNPASPIINMSYPVSMAVETYRALTETEKYANKTWMEIGATFMNTYTPAAKYLQRRTGLSSVLYINDTEAAVARREFFRWYFNRRSDQAREHLALEQKTQIAGYTEFGILQRQAKEMILADAPASEILTKLYKAAEEKVRADAKLGKTELDLETGLKSVRQSLLKARLIEGRGLTDADRSNLISNVSPEVYGQMVAHDILITAFADAVFEP